MATAAKKTRLAQEELEHGAESHQAITAALRERVWKALSKDEVQDLKTECQLYLSAMRIKPAKAIDPAREKQNATVHAFLEKNAELASGETASPT